METASGSNYPFTDFGTMGGRTRLQAADPEAVEGAELSN